MKIASRALFLTLTLFGFCANAVPLRIDWSRGAYGIRMFLPCTFGECMIDTGGRGNLLGSGDRGSLPVIATKVVNFVSGPETCDVLGPRDFELAGRPVGPLNFVSCDGVSRHLPPTLGLPALDKAVFHIRSSSNDGFNWVTANLDLPGKIYRHLGWIWVPVTIDDLATEAMFDTGAPLTLIDQSFADAHPELFIGVDVASPLPIGRMVALRKPLVISGIQLFAGPNMVIDLKKTFGESAPNIILGLQHILKGNWVIDLVNDRFSVRP